MSLAVRAAAVWRAAPLAGAALLLAPAPAAAAAPDTCAAHVPASLARQLASAFPDHRLPRVEDARPEDLGPDGMALAGGDGCMDVARADVDRDGRLDLMIGLMARDGRGGTIVIALARGAGWRIDVIGPLDAATDGADADAVHPASVPVTGMSLPTH